MRLVGDDVVMANCLEPVVICLHSVVELADPPTLGLESAAHTSKALADRY